MKRRASGTMIGVGLGVIAVVFGLTLWWFQTRAFYERVEGLESVAFQGRGLVVSDYRGIDAKSSPLKLRACFTQDWTLREIAPVPNPTPLVAPDWFDCFDAAKIGADLEAGRATAYHAGQEVEGFDRIIAVYPDGRAFMWRQLSEKYAE